MNALKPGQIYVGVGGWTFEPWRGPFYPKGLPHAKELTFASRALTSIEINGTFYRTQTPKTFRKWASETPEGFVFAVKGSRYITHMLRLANIRKPLANFFENLVAGLLLEFGQHVRGFVGGHLFHDLGGLFRFQRF